MYVNVTPSHFEELQKLAIDAKHNGYSKYIMQEMRRILEYCVKEFGGEYDYNRHMNGENVEIKVIKWEPVGDPKPRH